MAALGLTRREVLMTLLGAPLGAACARSGAGRQALPPGEIVFPSERRGHDVRATWSAEIPAERWQSCDVLVVGAGAAGLAAAWRLRGAGVNDLLVLDLDQALGGTAKAGQGALGRFPWGAHYVTVPFPENVCLWRLLGEMGVTTPGEHGLEIVEHALCREPEERVFYKGGWYAGLYLDAGATAQDRAELARFRALIDAWALWRDAQGRRAFAIPTAQSSTDPYVTALDRLSMTQWMDEQGLRSFRLRWLVDYACRDDYGATAERTSAWAGLLYFAARVREAGVDAQDVVTFPEGNGRFVEHLARGLDARLRTEQLVTDLVTTETGVEARVLGPDKALWGVRARRAIFAGPQFIARRVVRALRDEPGTAFPYGAWLVANLTLTGRPKDRGAQLAWDNVLVDSPSLGYVVATHQALRDHGPTMFTYYHPMCHLLPDQARQRLLEATRDDWADVVLSDLGRAHRDLRGLVSRLDVTRWGHAMVRPEPGFVWSAARRNAAVARGAVHFAHTDLSGVALFEEALDHGVRAAEEVLAALGRSQASWR